jgi:hypothetical protein
MMIGRRALLLAAGAAGLVQALPAAASVGQRRFALYRGDSRIGTQTIAVRRAGEAVEVAVDVDIEVRVLGISAYRYTLQSDEIWQDGALLRLVAQCNDNGEANFVRAERNGAELVVEGSKYSGRVGGTPATTTYWSPAFLERQVWISTQDGRPWRVSASRSDTVSYPTAAGDVTATRWRIGGELAGLDLFYDAAGEWVGSEFEARGETARFVVETRGAALSPLWTAA